MTSAGPKPPTAFSEFAAAHPEVAAAYDKLGEATRAAGPLTARETALVKMAISIGARMEGATRAHARKASHAGIERAALDQVAVLACPTIGFPNMIAAYGWIRDALEK